MKLSRRGLIATIVYHALIVLLLVFAGLTFPDPPPEEEGILVNFGTDETGFGDFEPMGDDQQAGDPELPVVEESPEIVEEEIEPIQETVETYTPPDPTPVDNVRLILNENVWNRSGLKRNVAKNRNELKGNASKGPSNLTTWAEMHLADRV